MGFWKLILSKVIGRIPPVAVMDEYTLAWNVREGKLFGLKVSAEGVKEVVPIGGAFNPATDLIHFCYIAWRDAPGDGFTLDPANSHNFEAILITHTELANPVEADFDGLWRFRATEGIMIADISFEYGDVADRGTILYVLDLKASFDYKILSATFATDAGTVNGVAVKINGTAVTGLSNVSATTSIVETAATAANDVRADDLVTLTATGVTNATVLAGKIKIQR